MFPKIQFAAAAVLSGVVLTAILPACGGGGGGGGDSATDSSGATGGGGGPPTAATLQSHLAACPTTATLNEAAPCMVGQYEGKTTDTGDACTFVYGRDGVATYSAGGQSVQANPSATLSGAVFEKKAAGGSAGFSITWAVGIASGNDMDLSYQLDSEPASANGLFVKPKKAAVPSCLITTGPATPATSASSTANDLSRAWQSPQLLNGSAGALSAVSGEAAFVGGLADDGRAFVAFRQPDGTGRVAVQVVEGTPGAAGQSPTWTAPQVLDDAAPLLAGGFLPAIAVSANGHAVVMWANEHACDADGYYSVNTGKTCRYVYASRRLATASNWEVPVRVAPAPLTNKVYFARINSRGDVVLVFSGAKLRVPELDSTPNVVDDRIVIARRSAAEVGYRLDRSNYLLTRVTTRVLSEWVRVGLDDDGEITIAGETGADFGAILHTRMDMTQPLVENADLTHAALNIYQSASGGGGTFAYAWKSESGPLKPLKPQQLTVYSPATQEWLKSDLAAVTQWGDTVLAGTDNAAGEFLLYSGCKLSVWRAGTWLAPRDLPAYCGRDQAGGTYAFNRKGDYLGLNWAGKAGQWGYYSYAQDKLLKGAPGSGTAASGDYVLGTASPLFGAAPTQVLLAPNGLGLALASNLYTSLPSAGNDAGTMGASAVKLWAVYLK